MHLHFYKLFFLTALNFFAVEMLGLQASSEQKNAPDLPMLERAAIASTACTAINMSGMDTDLTYTGEYCGKHLEFRTFTFKDAPGQPNHPEALFISFKENEENLYVAFPGMMSCKDLPSVLKCDLSFLGDKKSHDIFHSMLNAEETPNKHTIFVGHSLGGKKAALIASAYAKENDQIFTFGTPLASVTKKECAALSEKKSYGT